MGISPIDLSSTSLTMAKITEESNGINQFLIYEIEPSTPEQQLLHPVMSNDAALANSKQIIEGCFMGKKLVLNKFNRDGTIEWEYPNDVLSVHDGVYLVRINNKKYKTLVRPAETTTNGVQDYEEVSELSNPYCYVVVDNRHDIGQIAIQKKSSWGNPDTIRNVLMTNLNHKFQREGIPLHIDISMKMRPSEIEEFCARQCIENGDHIKQISFVLPNQKNIPFNHRISTLFTEPDEYMLELIRMMEVTHAAQTFIRWVYKEDADMDGVDTMARQLATVLRVCRSSTYQLVVKFRDYGTYKCDELVRAIFPMDEKLIHAFWNNWEELQFNEGEKFGLIAWCNEVLDKSELYRNVKHL